MELCLLWGFEVVLVMGVLEILGDGLVDPFGFSCSDGGAIFGAGSDCARLGNSICVNGFD